MFCFGCAALRVWVSKQKISLRLRPLRGEIFSSEPPQKAHLGVGSGALSRRFAQECPEGNRANTNRRNDMAIYENKVTLKGYLGKDAESFATKQQKTFIVLSLATKSGYKDKQKEEWVNHTEWHRIVAFGTPAGYAKDLKKGDYVEIEGELRSTERGRSRQGQEEDEDQAPQLGDTRQPRQEAGAT
jgi:Single-strand binding protein family